MSLVLLVLGLFTLLLLTLTGYLGVHLSFMMLLGAKINQMGEHLWMLYYISDFSNCLLWLKL